MRGGDPARAPPRGPPAVPLAVPATGVADATKASPLRATSPRAGTVALLDLLRACGGETGRVPSAPLAHAVGEVAGAPRVLLGAIGSRVRARDPLVAPRDGLAFVRVATPRVEVGEAIEAVEAPALATRLGVVAGEDLVLLVRGLAEVVVAEILAAAA